MEDFPNGEQTLNIEPGQSGWGLIWQKKENPDIKKKLGTEKVLKPLNLGPGS